ncbi:MAG: metal ABC transporter solute-binding protein, Zn/Mn family, partial [Janthinobacterium lividum]
MSSCTAAAPAAFSHPLPPSSTALPFSARPQSLFLSGRKAAVLLLLSLLLLLRAGMAWAAQPIPVLATFSLLGDIVAQVGGQRVAVSTLVGADADAHAFQPSPADVKAITRARLVVVNGLGFEGWIERLVRNAAYKGPVLVASNGIALRKLPGGGSDTSRTDPHAWQDPANVAVYVRNIEAALVQLDADGATLYHANAGRYLARLA